MDRCRARTTSRDYKLRIARFLKQVGKPVNEINTDDIRNHMLLVREKLSADHYINVLSAMKAFFRDHL